MNTAGGYATDLSDITPQLNDPGPSLAESQFDYIFMNTTGPLEAVLDPGPDGDVTVQWTGWVPAANGYPAFDSAQLYATKFGPGGELMFRRVQDPFPVNILDFEPAGNEVVATITFNPAQEGLTVDHDGLFGVFMNGEGGGYATRTVSLTLNKKF